MRVRHLLPSLLAAGVFVFMCVGQTLSVIEESMSTAHGQQPAAASKNVQRCRELERRARTQYNDLVAGEKALWEVVESAQKRIDVMHKADPVDKEASGRLHFVMLFATIQANKQSESIQSALSLAADAATAEVTHAKTRQEIPDAIMHSFEQTSKNLDVRLAGVASLTKEMNEVIAHPERPFPKPKE